MKYLRMYLPVFLTVLSLITAAAFAADDSPALIGRQTAKNIMAMNIPIMDITYPTVCARYGVLIFADATNDRQLIDRMQRQYKPFLWGIRVPLKNHVDNNVFGIVPFELHRQTGNPDYLDLALKLADDEYREPREDGLSTYTRMWVDDMYMVGSLQIQAYKATNDPKYADRAVTQVLAYCQELQHPNGLFSHTLDAPIHWGRGNGWAAASMAEILQVLPADHPRRDELLAAYRKMMAQLIEVQDPTGMWHQVLDEPQSFMESSCSGMFIFAMATGVREGWLPAEKYMEPVQRGWSALAGYVDHGRVSHVCIGTNAKNDKQHYMKRPTIKGDAHGQAAVLWAATAMYLLAE